MVLGCRFWLDLDWCDPSTSIVEAGREIALTYVLEVERSIVVILLSTT